MKIKFYDSKTCEVKDTEPVKYAINFPPVVIKAAKGIEIDDIETEQERLSELLDRKVVIIRYGYEVIRGI
ncbi:hypothetical protein [Clostridioides sp. ES-S-0001-02]|uniref:hypothetical protein n=1 Tax=Clostridioides sp. ES-S-0001-02 TaxID=2770770 RepID=UPI001D10B879|nr:hypothetical protein [Clostridioides sp. ES-S-0001-02]